jgi:hypothetical protein
MTEQHGDLQHDAALSDALRDATPAPPIDDVDWQTLHAGVMRRAAPLLARAPRQSWWQLIAGWSMPAIPVGTLAAAALLLIVASNALLPRTRPAATDTVAFITLEEELALGSAPLLAAGADADDVIDALLFSDMEAR